VLQLFQFGIISYQFFFQNIYFIKIPFKWCSCITTAGIMFFESRRRNTKHTVDVAIDGMEDPIEELVLRYRYSKLMKIDDIARLLE